MCLQTSSMHATPTHLFSFGPTATWRAWAASRTLGKKKERKTLFYMHHTSIAVSLKVLGKQKVAGLDVNTTISYVQLHSSIS